MRKLVLAAAALALGACGNSQQPAAQPAAAAAPDTAAVHQAVQLTPSQQQGQIIYQSVCWSCHGTDGRGNGPAVEAGTVTAPPTFLDLRYATASLQELQEQFNASVNGKDPNHPHMQYVASLLKPDKFADALSYIPALSYPQEIPGSAIAGQRIYQYRCAPCHGKTGEGDGPASEFLTTVKPANFTTDTLLAKKDWNVVFNKVKAGGQGVHGSSMPPWGIILSENDIWDVVAYLSTFQPGLVSKPAWLP
jgi:mono/diheme cytochrome c family protein